MPERFRAGILVDMEMRVVRATRHFDEACRFYGELLGWPVTKEWTDGGRGRIFGHGDSARIEFLEAGTDTGDEPVTGVFVSAEVDDLDTIVAQLERASIALAEPPTTQPWGHRNLAVIDPTGLRLVLFQVL
jgi:predicted enzyme related to lactoylglutathione lyase